MQVTELLHMVDILKKPMQLDFTLNELRIIVGCFRAVAYMAERDDEPYLDPEGLELHARLEELYSQRLAEMEDDSSQIAGNG